MINDAEECKNPVVIIITNKVAVDSTTEQLMTMLRESCAHEINVIHSYNPADLAQMLSSKNEKRTDVLITTAECISNLLDCMLDIFNSERLQSIWFNETDELRLLDEKGIHRLFSAISNKQVLFFLPSFEFKSCQNNCKLF